MKLKINSVVGLLTNLRWDWLNLIFLLILLRGGVRSKVIFMTRGGGGVRQKVIFDDEGGRGGKPKSDFWWRGGGGGVQTPPKKDDIIYEQPLINGACPVKFSENVLFDISYWVDASYNYIKNVTQCNPILVRYVSKCIANIYLYTLGKNQLKIYCDRHQGSILCINRSFKQNCPSTCERELAEIIG